MSASLSSFILEHIDAILREWEAFARTIPAARFFTRPDLCDHAHAILVLIAHDLALPQSAEQQREKSQGRGVASPLDDMARQHGSARMADGFTASDAIAEYRALRASVLRQWAALGRDVAAAAGDPVARELTRFNEAIDQALTESLSRYTEARDRQFQLFDALLSSSPDLNYIVDLQGQLIYANRAFATIVGSTPSGLRGASLYQLLGPFAPGLADSVRDVIASRRTHRAELKVNIGRRGRAVYEYLLVPALDGEGRCIGAAGSARDVTDRNAALERQRHNANFDHLTRLPNRNMFQEALLRETKHALRSGRSLGLLFIDLDGFKGVNDRLGHQAGDQLLKQVARRISARVRETDTVARLGGDEFTVILTDVARTEAVAHLADGLLSELAQPFALAAGEASISASVGIGLFPEQAHSTEELVHHADAAMYAAKSAGRNCFRFYDGAARS